MSDTLFKCFSWLNRTEWHYLFGLVFFMHAAAFIVTLGAAPGSARAAVWTIVNSAALALLAAKLLTVRYGGLDRRRAAASRKEGWRGQLIALVPVWLLAWMRTDRANMAALLRWGARRPVPPQPDGIDFPFLAKSAYSTLFMCALVSLLVELPMDGLIASVMTRDPEARQMIRWGLAAAGLYTLAWLLGDRLQLKAGHQVVGAENLELLVGSRLSASIPLTAIVDCETLKETPAAWRARKGIAADDTLLATPADGPNVVICIDPASHSRLKSWNVERDAPRYLFLFADDPGAMVQDLKGSIAKQPR